MNGRSTEPAGFATASPTSAACPVCRADRTAFHASARDRIFGIAPGCFELRRCSGCGCVFQHPIPDGPRLASFYPEEYWWSDTGSTGSAVSRLLHRLERAIRRARSSRTGEPCECGLPGLPVGSHCFPCICARPDFRYRPRLLRAPSLLGVRLRFSASDPGRRTVGLVLPGRVLVVGNRNDGISDHEITAKTRALLP